MKATYKGKYYGTGYDRNSVYMTYEYRGMEYEVHENRSKGNEPLSWQHKTEQERIDRILDTDCKSTESAQVGFEKFWDYVENGIGWED